MGEPGPIGPGSPTYLVFQAPLLPYWTTSVTVAVRVTDPAVAVIPTLEVPAGVGEVPEHPTTTPSPTSVIPHRKNKRNRLALPNERLRRNTIIDANGSRKA